MKAVATMKMYGMLTYEVYNSWYTNYRKTIKRSEC